MEQFISIIVSLCLGFWQGRRSKVKKLKKIVANLEVQIQTEKNSQCDCRDISAYEQEKKE